MARAPKITAKPTFTEAIEFGSLEHRKLAALHHHGLVPWQIHRERTDADAVAKRVRLNDAARLARNEIKTARAVAVCKLDDGSNGVGVFFLHTQQPDG